MNSSSLQKPTQVLLFFLLLFAAAYYGRPFLVPVVMSALLAMLLLPFCGQLERRKVPRVAAVLICLLSMMAVVAGVVFLLSWQVADLASEAATIERNLSERLSQLRSFIDKTFGISRQQQKDIINSGQPSGVLQHMISTLLAGMGGLLASMVLVFVYVFLFLYLRNHIRQFVLLLVPAADRPHAARIMSQCRMVAQHYLVGMALMIGSLWVLYGIAFSIVGVKNALFFAVLCGLLEIVPFVGNLTGSLFTLMTVVAQGGSGGMVLGVVLTYAVVQFVQTYLLEPLIVGAEVSINALATIVAIVVGQLVWGIPGMVLAIPLLGIVKIICDNVEPWRPVGFLLGSTHIKKKRARRKG